MGEGVSESRRRSPRVSRSAFAAFALLVLAGLAGAALLWPSGRGEPATPAPHPGRPTVVFIVLDTVRSDHLSFCGYERPTSPNLDRIAGSAQAATCDAYAPGSWTIPSHASFFTGEEVATHGAGVRPEGVQLEWGRKFNALDGTLPTLAERMREAGYQTVSLSGNPVLMDASGLLRGFDKWLSADTFGQLYGESLVRGLARLLDGGVDPSGGPLFLFVNIADAHTPWSAIPPGVAWLPPQPAIAMSLDPGSPFHHYVSGDLPSAQAREFRQRYINAYDYGVSRADRTLGLVLDELEVRGWFRHGRRLVITSDHGEFLGDHGLVGHGVYLYEGNARVPFVFVGEDPAVDVAGRFGAIEGFRVAQGEPPRAHPWIQAVSFPSHRKAAAFPENSGLYRQTSAVIWRGSEKLRWMDGELVRYDLAADPTEQAPLALGPHPLRASLEALAQRAIAVAARSPAQSDGLAERLRALGYAE